MLDSVYTGCEMATLLMVLYSRSKKLRLPQPEYQPRTSASLSNSFLQSLSIGLPTEERTVITTRAVKRGEQNVKKESLRVLNGRYRPLRVVIQQQLNELATIDGLDEQVQSLNVEFWVDRAQWQS